MRDRTVTEEIFAHLLAHFWDMHGQSNTDTYDLAPKGWLLSYGDLVERSGVPLNPRNAGGPLFEVAEFCASQSWPPLHALVVAKETHYPGEGFFRAPGSSHQQLPFEAQFKAWQEGVERCVSEGPSKFPKTLANHLLT